MLPFRDNYTQWCSLMRLIYNDNMMKINERVMIINYFVKVIKVTA